MTSTDLHSIILGSGNEQIVVLHGWNNNLEYWRPIGELLSVYATIHLVDLPGFGKSAVPPKTWGVEDYATCITQYLKEKNINKATFIGHSFGGRISVVIAATCPTLVSNLILVNTHGLAPKRTVTAKIKIAYIKILRNIVKSIDKVFFTKLFVKWFAPKYGSIDYKSAGALKDTFIKVVNQDLASFAKRITAKTLLLWGELDTETPLSIGQKYNQLIAGSKLIVLKDKGHDMFMDVGGHLLVFHILKFLGLGEQKRSVNE